MCLHLTFNFFFFLRSFAQTGEATLVIQLMYNQTFVESCAHKHLDSILNTEIKCQVVNKVKFANIT